MLVAVVVFMLVRMRMIVFMLVIVPVIMRVPVRFVGMAGMRIVCVGHLCRLAFVREHIHLGRGQAAAHHLAGLETGADIQCRRRVAKERPGELRHQPSRPAACRR